MGSLILPDREFEVLSSAARTADFESADFVNRYYPGIVFFIDVTAASGVDETLDVQLNIKDPVSGLYFANGAATQILAVGTAMLVIHPAITELSGVRRSRPLTQTWRLDLDIGGTGPSFTFSIGASYIL